jgi:hypothetical protein
MGHNGGEEVSQIATRLPGCPGTNGSPSCSSSDRPRLAISIPGGVLLASLVSAECFSLRIRIALSRGNVPGRDVGHGGEAPPRADTFGHIEWKNHCEMQIVL